MTLQIRSRIEYLIATDNILVSLLHSNLSWNVALTTGFQYYLMTIQNWLTFYWATLYSDLQFRAMNGFVEHFCT